jgi:deoxyribose-phosphate aldolase
LREAPEPETQWGGRDFGHPIFLQGSSKHMDRVRTYTTGPVPPVDQVATDARAAAFKGRSVKKEAKRQALDLIVRCIDLTTLEGMDTPGKVTMLCQKARYPMGENTVPPVAAVCIYPSLVSVARDALAGSPVRVASVATAFPSGQSDLNARLQEIEDVVEAGADEVDVVINRNALLSGDSQRVFDELVAMKAACGKAHIKVILETGELQTYDLVRKAAHIALDAGADFIKTSTGKVKPAATLAVALVMMQTVRDHYLRTGHEAGVKVAGGIRTAKVAWQYLAMAKETLGDRWLTPERFRIGASSLLNDVLMQWVRLDDHRYQSPVYFSVD